MLSSFSRKNGWQLAESLGDPTPDGVQSLLGRARWNADDVRNELQQCVTEHLGDPGGVLMVDETGFLKKGKHSVGVSRQSSGTAGRIENCPIGVLLAYATVHGHALIDRRLSLLKNWSEDSQRRQRAHVPTSVKFCHQAPDRSANASPGSGDRSASSLGVRRQCLGFRRSLSTCHRAARIRFRRGSV